MRDADSVNPLGLKKGKVYRAAALSSFSHPEQKERCSHHCGSCQSVPGKGVSQSCRPRDTASVFTVSCSFFFLWFYCLFCKPVLKYMFSVLAKMLLLPVRELDGKDHACPYQGDKSTLGAKLFLGNGSAHRHFLEELHEVWIFLEVVLLRQEFPQLLFNLKMLNQCLAQCFTQNFN